MGATTTTNNKQRNSYIFYIVFATFKIVNNNNKQKVDVNYILESNRKKMISQNSMTSREIKIIAVVRAKKKRTLFHLHDFFC